MIDSESFKEYHLRRTEEMKTAMAELLLKIRLRNQLTRQFVSDYSGLSERGIVNLEKNNRVSIDAMMQLFRYYYKNGYTTTEDQERWRGLGEGNS